MTKLEAGMRYEMQKLLKHIAFFIVGAVAFVGAIQVIFLPVTGFEGFGSVGFSGAYTFVFLFLVFWTAIAFGKDAGLFLQSGFTRRELFVVFVVAVVAEALVFALLDAMLSLAVPGFWREQSFFLRIAGSYTAALFVQIFLLNLAVASCTLVVTALQRRIGTGWTATILIGLYVFVALILPVFFFSLPGGGEAWSGFVMALMWSPFEQGQPIVFYLILVLVSASLTWFLLRRVNADRFAAGR
ncbi:hypothetical protein [Eggerthella sp. YY7918]|uniref:hypothetical protein n=1 Tax=Eggerthella sp. (strain YY7918) TaxID=502558 RepID=UPI0002171460|nr:hypothetical protein [Eggerthella sp. YY7918]BAK44876.1 integral membrane protein [Eggerthella sp. YY7918]